MATLPSFESILLKISQSLGIDFSESMDDEIEKLKDRRNHGPFEKCEDRYDVHKKRLNGIVEEICGVLAEEKDREWLRREFGAFETFCKDLELSTYTFDANERQILWYLLGYVYMPFFGRKLAILQHDQPLDQGMPGGKFWYLPQPKGKDGNVVLIMPVAHVVEWLSDLFDCPMDQFKDKLGFKDTEPDSIERTLYRWLQGDLPKIINIERYFSEKCQLDFKGCFKLSSAPDIASKLGEAKAFLKKKGGKGITSENLSYEIPMKTDQIAEILAGKAPEVEQQRFIELLTIRYAAPSLQTIRQRLLIARAAHYGYRELVKFLCQEIDETSTDPAKNKVVQLLMIFQSAYNFASPWDGLRPKKLEDEYGVDPSKYLLSWHNGNLEPAKNLGVQLSNFVFKQSNNENFLDDIYPYSNEVLKTVVNKNVSILTSEMSLEEKCTGAREKIKKEMPWKALQSIDDFNVIKYIATNEDFHEKIRDMATNRMKKTAKNDDQKIIVIITRLNWYLNGARIKRPETCAKQVEDLLILAEKNPSYKRFESQLLQYRAKHYLAQNEFDLAGKLFRKALETCSERNFGPFRGEIARDLFALSVAKCRLIPENHEKYFRNALFCKMFELKNPDDITMEEAALSAANYFWDDLYKPYPKVKPDDRPIKKLMEEFNKYIMTIILEDNWHPLEAWILKYPKYKSKPLPDVRGGTIIREWLRLFDGHKEVSALISAGIPEAECDEREKIKKLEINARNAIVIAVKKWPQLLNLPDYKSQTPLMLAAEHGDRVLLKAFLDAGAKINNQDFEGYTALHAASRGGTDEIRQALIAEGIAETLPPNSIVIKEQCEHDSVSHKRSYECAELLLDKEIDATLTTINGETAMHTAVRFGRPDIVNLLRYRKPELADIKNEEDQNPLGLLEWILSDWLRFTECMQDESGRKYGSIDEYKKIREILVSSSFS